jgi:hypothetical protein
VVLDCVHDHPAGKFHEFAPKPLFRLRKGGIAKWLARKIHKAEQLPGSLSGLDRQLMSLRQERIPDYDLEDAQECILGIYNYTLDRLRVHKPELMITWNQFHPLSRAAQAAARDASVKIAFLEYGLLPGTLNFDFSGQMGESDIVRLSAEFEAAPLDKNDIDAAEDTLSRLRNSTANRRPQIPMTDIKRDLANRAQKRPIIFFAGHNDHASGTTPFDGHARRFHSPIFDSSDAAALTLSKLASENNWFLLVKPHPFCKLGSSLSNNSNTYVLTEDYDINECVKFSDVVVTAISQTSYLALIYQRPLVMIGYNQLRGSGSHFQAETLEDVEICVRLALSDGVTNEQIFARKKHIARLTKHYLFPYTEPGPISKGLRDHSVLVQKIENYLAQSNAPA